MSSWETWFSRAISILISCTSAAPRYLKTSAALSSSSASNKMALLRAPFISAIELLIGIHPATNDHRDHAGVFLSHFTQVIEVMLIE